MKERQRIKSKATPYSYGSDTKGQCDKKMASLRSTKDTFSTTLIFCLTFESYAGKCDNEGVRADDAKSTPFSSPVAKNMDHHENNVRCTASDLIPTEYRG